MINLNLNILYHFNFFKVVFFLSSVLTPLNVFANKEPAENIYGHIYDSYDLKPVSNAEIIYSDKIYYTDSSGLF
ncbi:MAG TPA: hypothetical protein DEP28_09170, partial [Bacteroidetes bacterium]|nr:hypothetical protein [Bacteroidota bacterium]